MDKWTTIIFDQKKPKKPPKKQKKRKEKSK